MDLTKDAILNGYIKLPDYQKILISAGIMLLLGGAYFYFLYMPKMEELEESRKKLADLQTKVSQVRAVAETLPKFEAEHKIVGEKLEKALTQLPSSDELPKLIRDMENLGRSAGVAFQSLQLGKEVPKAFYAEVPVKLKLTGVYHDIAMFFDKLSQLPRIINVSDIDFGKPKSEEGKMLLDINCVATTYKFIEKGKK